MSQATAPNNHLPKIKNQLKLLEDLWQKLYYVKWNPKSFIMLARLAQGVVQDAHQHGDPRITDLATQLEVQVQQCANSSSTLAATERQRLAALIDALHSVTSASGKLEDDEPRTRPMLGMAAQPTVFLISPQEHPPLLAKLTDASYRAQHFTTLAAAEQRLYERIPNVIIADLDFPQGAEAVLEMFAKLDSELNLRQVLLLFLTERNDMAARVEAVRVGSNAYFRKPFDDEQIINRLRELLLPQTSQGHYRVLIVNDRPTEAWEIAGALEEQGITPRVAIQPLQVLQDMQRFRPDLLLIDLDLKEIGGPQLAAAIVQNQDFATLPLILTCFPTDLANYIEQLDTPGASIMLKPVSANYLCWEIMQRLRQGRALRVRIGQLTDNDPISGLYNRGHFVALLEHELEALGLRIQTLTVLFIMFDNLRTIRDSAGVATADEMIGQAASRVRTILGGNQIAARFSDAIFAVLAPNLSNDAALILARRLREALETGFYRMGEQALLLRTSIGIASTNDRSQDHLALIQRADSACGLAAREAKGERIYIQQAQSAVVTDDQEPSARVAIIKQVQEAIKNEWMWLVFQPVASMRGDANERYEVLLRLRNSEGQDVAPGKIFGMVYDHTSGLELDRWVITQALDMLKQRRRTTTLFIKLLPVTLQDKGFAAWLRERLEKTAVPGQSLAFQISETTAERSLSTVVAFLRGIKVLGCGFCVDHFGQSDNSLNLIRSVGADYVKLDMRFANNLAKDTRKQAQLKELVEKLAEIGVATIVCGVEDVQTMPIVWGLGVDLIQGFFLQRPYREMSYDFSGGAF